MSDIRSVHRGAIAHLTLDRPKALNALTMGMVLELDNALDQAEADLAVAAVVLDGAGGRAFCAGGDVVAVRASALAGDDLAAEFWRAEYALDLRIAGFSKPVVTLMDGIVMGGGVGLAAHASHRIVTETLVAAMPEVGIGFVPDVGSTWLLSRAPGDLGTHLGLTGGRFGAADALLTGFADFHVRAANLPGLIDDLAAVIVDPAAGGAPAATRAVDACIARVAGDPGEAGLASAQVWIDEAYTGDDVAAIVERLRSRPERAAQATADDLETRSPTAVSVTLAALRRARELPTLLDCIDRELVVSLAMLTHPDFAEGVRAQLVDKDRKPRWHPSTLAGVSEDTVRSLLG